VNDDAIQRTLERLGEALSTGDAQGAARCWDVPGLVLSDDGVRAIAERSEIEQFFTQAIAWYRSQGVMTTRPMIERIEALSAKLAAVDVRWPGFDAAGHETDHEKGSERSHYILRIADDGEARIQVALTRTT
jgi:hypothetical protein